MMKRKILIAVIAALTVHMEVWSQTIQKRVMEVTYLTVPASPKIISLMKSQSPDSEKLKAAVDLLYNYKFYHRLLINIQNNASLFKMDSVKKVEQVKITGFCEFAFKNPAGTFYSNESFMNTNYTIKGSTEEYDWAVSKDTMNIGGYTCYRATLKQIPDIVAWFAPEIPANSGPFIYHGLPGLIMQLETNFETVRATDIKYTTSDSEFVKELGVLRGRIEHSKVSSVKESVAAKTNFMAMMENQLRKKKEL